MARRWSLRRRALGVALDTPAVAHREVLDDSLDLGALVPEVEQGPRRVVGHAGAVRAGGGGDDVVALGGREAPLPRDHVQAGAEALDVPLPRARDGLVEVVEVEDEVPLRAGVLPEVAHVRVAARLDPDAGGRHPREIHRHHCRGAPEERERRLGHPLVADRPELGQARGRLGFEHGERVLTSRRRAPLTERRAGHLRVPRHDRPPGARPAPGPSRSPLRASRERSEPLGGARGCVAERPRDRERSEPLGGARGASRSDPEIRG